MIKKNIFIEFLSKTYTPKVESRPFSLKKNISLKTAISYKSRTFPKHKTKLHLHP